VAVFERREREMKSVSFSMHEGTHGTTNGRLRIDNRDHAQQENFYFDGNLFQSSLDIYFLKVEAIKKSSLVFLYVCMYVPT
jgi:hypothetical protein